MRATLPVLATAIAVVLSGSASVTAHHAFSAEFDANRPVILEGTVTKMDWVNPHSWIHIDVVRPDGKVEKWMIEGGTPNTLLRRGLRRTDLPAGTKIKVEGYQAKDGGLRANGRNLTLPDGRALFLGGTGAGVPK
jgi:hypothetical protein